MGGLILPMDTLRWMLLLICLSSAAAVAWERSRRLRAEQAAANARATGEAATRLLRLSAGDQRNVALALFAQAEGCGPPAAALSALARRLFDLSEGLLQQTDVPDAPRTLAEEDLPLMPAVAFAMAQVASHLGPSRRAWRIDETFEATRLFADRRALNEVLVNVLSAAAAATRDGDWIELSAQPAEDEWCIVVQDEGIGLPLGQGGPASGDAGESRGIGLRLTLARSLMQAHGGSLVVESTERVGTKVRLGFPAARLLATEGQRLLF